MDPRSLRLTNRLNNEEEQILNIDSRLIADRQNIRRLDNEMARQEQYTERQDFINHNNNRNHHINVAIFILLGILIIVVAVIAGLAYEKSHNARFDENSINAHELDNTDSYTMAGLNLTSGSNGALTIKSPGGITFGASQITADEFRVIDGAIAGTVVANKATVVDSNRNIHGFGYITAGGASFTDGVCFKSLAKFEAGMSVVGGTSFSNLTKFHNGICVLGGTSFGNRVNFYDGICVGGTLYSYGGLSVSGTTNFSNLVTVESNTGLSVQGGVSMSGLINMYSQLNSTQGICILGGLSVSGDARFYGTHRVQKHAYINTADETTITANIPYLLTKEQSGYEFNLDYNNKNHIQVVLPEISATDTNLNYKFSWVEGPSIGDKHAFELVAGGRNNTMSGFVNQQETNTTNSYIISTNSVDGSINASRLDLGAKIIDGSTIHVKSYKGRWIVDGDLGTSPSNRGLNLFQDHSYKQWVVGGTSFDSSNNNGRVSMLFSENAKNYHMAYHLPTFDNDYCTVSSIAFGEDNSGTSLYVATIGGQGTNGKNIMYSDSGTSWQFVSGAGTCFVGTGVFGFGRGVAYGTNNVGERLWVAVGGANSSNNYNNILFSHGSNVGTCWMNSHSDGVAFNLSGQAVAFGASSNGTCLWVAAGSDNSANNKMLLWSADGMCWAPSVESGASFNQIAYTVGYGTDNNGDRIWVAGGFDTSDNYRKLLWSTDGMCWAKSDSAGAAITESGSEISSVGYGMSSDGTCLWVAGVQHFGSGTNPILYSANGKLWTAALNNTMDLTNKSVSGVAFGTSSDGTCIWVASALPAPGTPAEHNNIIYSVDGKNWYPSDTGAAVRQNHSVVFSHPMYPNTNNIIDEIYGV